MKKADIRIKNMKSQQAYRDRKRADGCEQVLIWLDADNVDVINELAANSGLSKQKAREKIINNLIAEKGPKLTLEMILAKQVKRLERVRLSEKQLNLKIED
jgi:uncharacterized protein YpmB